MVDVCTIRLTVPVVPFELKNLNFGVDEEHVDSPVEALGRLAHLVSNNIGRHTDDFSLWNRYAQSCLEKGGNRIIKYCISFQDEDDKSLGLSYPPHFWAVYLTPYKTPILLSFYRRSEGDHLAQTWLIQTQRMLQQARLGRGYIIVMDPMCLRGQDDEEMRYYYKPNVVEITNFYDRLTCGGTPQDSKPAAGKRSFPPTAAAQKNDPTPVSKRSHYSNPVRKIVGIAKYAEMFDLTAGDDDTEETALSDALVTSRVGQKGNEVPLTVHGEPCKLCSTERKCTHHLKSSTSE